MIAVQKACSGVALPTLVHVDVVEVPNALQPNRRKFTCRCCGTSWTEDVNSPLRIEDEEVINHLDRYYPKYVKCNQ